MEKEVDRERNGNLGISPNIIVFSLNINGYGSKQCPEISVEILYSISSSHRLEI